MTEARRPLEGGRRQNDRLVVASSAFQKSVDLASGVARSETPLLLIGPDGSGKSHLARAIHAWSTRAGEGLVVARVSGHPGAVQERELFGVAVHEEPLLEGGHDGALARAARGTLVIDSIDELADNVRGDLVKSVREGSFRRVSSGEATPLRARILGLAETGDQKLLGDLAAPVIPVQPLAQRVEDILPLAAHFLAIFANEAGTSPVGYTAEALRWLVECPWTGNVRELRERVRQAVQLSGDGAVSAESLMLSIEGDDVPSFKEAKRAFETRYVESLLRRCSGNISRAARLAKKDRKDFYDVIRRTGVNPSDFRP